MNNLKNHRKHKIFKKRNKKRTGMMQYNTPLNRQECHEQGHRKRLERLQLSELKLMQDMSWTILLSCESSARANRMSSSRSRDSCFTRLCCATWQTKQIIMKKNSMTSNGSVLRKFPCKTDSQRFQNFSIAYTKYGNQHSD